MTNITVGTWIVPVENPEEFTGPFLVCAVTTRLESEVRGNEAFPVNRRYLTLDNGNEVYAEGWELAPDNDLRAALAAILERGERVNEWPEDEARAYRDLRFEAGRRAAQAIRVDKILALTRGDEEFETSWAGDERATHWYDTREEAEEFIGKPRQFRRRKAGPWKPVEASQ